MLPGQECPIQEPWLFTRAVCFRKGHRLAGIPDIRWIDGCSFPSFRKWSWERKVPHPFGKTNPSSSSLYPFRQCRSHSKSNLETIPTNARPFSTWATCAVLDQAKHSQPKWCRTLAWSSSSHCSRREFNYVVVPCQPFDSSSSRKHSTCITPWMEYMQRPLARSPGPAAKYAYPTNSPKWISRKWCREWWIFTKSCTRSSTAYSSWWTTWRRSIPSSHCRIRRNHSDCRIRQWWEPPNEDNPEESFLLQATNIFEQSNSPDADQDDLMMFDTFSLQDVQPKPCV